MRKIVGGIAFFAVLLPSWVLLGVPVLIGEGAQWASDHVVGPMLDSIEEWMGTKVLS